MNAVPGLTSTLTRPVIASARVAQISPYPLGILKLFTPGVTLNWPELEPDVSVSLLSSEDYGPDVVVSLIKDSISGG